MDLQIQPQYRNFRSKLPIALVVLIVTLYAVALFRSYWKLRQFRGPPVAAVTNLWWVRVACSGRAHAILEEVHDRYGQFCRIGPNTLLSTDEELFRKMGAVRSPYRRSDWYKAFKFDADRENMFSETDEIKHMNMRNKVVAGYSGKENPCLEADIDRVVWTLFNTINTRFLSQGSDLKPLDFAKAMQYFTLDIISSLFISHTFGFIADFEDKFQYNKTMHENVPAMTLMSAVPELSRMIRVPFIQRNVLPSVKDKIGMGRIKAGVRDLLNARFEPGVEKQGRSDIVQSFIDRGLNRDEIADESLMSYLAGSDTSATILRSGFVQILANHRIYSRLQAECDAAGVPADEIISQNRASQLPYLNACMKEMLRFHPAATGLLPRVVPPKGDTHDGVYLPPGTEIGFCAWKVYRHNYAAYGSDANVFKPERWTEATPEDAIKMEKSHELIFGYGRFKCVGERIARIEILKTVFELIRRYDMSLMDPMKPMESSINYGLWLQQGMWVKIEKRNPAPVV